MHCKVCGEEQPERFYRSIGTYCKEHWKARVKENRENNAEYYREYERLRATLPHRIEARQAFAQSEGGEESSRRRAGKVIDGSTPQRRAHIMTGNAIRDGKLIKQPCYFCGSENNIQAHHEDYSKPLDVTWLCASCHQRLHAMRIA